MGEFFQGWRRKAGCLTLALACVLTVAWMRSRVVDDRLQLASQTLISSAGSIAWLSDPSGDVIDWSSDPADPDGVVFLLGYGRETRLIMSLPYWSLVLPPTLLSAWLIWGARKAKGVRSLPLT